MSSAGTTEPIDIPPGCRVEEQKQTLPMRLITPGLGWSYHVNALPFEDFGGMNGSQLAGLRHTPDHPLMQEVDATCSKCSAPLRCRRVFAGNVACDGCRAKALEQDQEDRHEKYWSQEHLCPPKSEFRATDPNHPNFPKGPYEATKAYAGLESLFFYGPTGHGKSRLAVHLLKRCLFRFNLFVGILWPEDLKHACKSYERRDELKRWGKFDVLLMDDSLLTGAQDEKMTDFLKDLLDYRLRNGRHHIITSQIGGDDYEEQLSKYVKSRGLDVTSADKRRVEALLRRIRESCQKVIPFVDAPAKEGEEQF